MDDSVRRAPARRRSLLRALAAGSTLTAALALAGAPGPAQAAGAGALTIDHLTVDRQSAPLGLGERDPNLGWRLSGDGRARAQSSYRVLVASSASALAAGRGNVWDSGRVQGAASANVDYQGPPLASDTTYHWKVQVWDERGRASGWSAPASFATGLLDAADWHASWIAAPADTLDLSGAKWLWTPPRATRPAAASPPSPAGCAAASRSRARRSPPAASSSRPTTRPPSTSTARSSPTRTSCARATATPGRRRSRSTSPDTSEPA